MESEAERGAPHAGAGRLRPAQPGKTIEELYRNYGAMVINAVKDHASRASGLRELMSKLRIEDKGPDLRRTHEQILGYLQTHGATKFLMELGYIQSAPEHESAGGRAPQTLNLPQHYGQQLPPAAIHAAAAPLIAPPAPAPPPAAAQPQWIYQDRRSGVERRSGKERRESVDMVFKNRRFGGDRRSGKERRQKQIPPPWPA